MVPMVALALGLMLHGRPPVQTPRAAVKLGMFDFFSDPGKDTRVPSGFANAAHILISGVDAEEKASALTERIAGNEISFEDAATQYSECPSKGKGGDLGVFSSLAYINFLPYEGKAVKAFDEVVFSPSTPLDTLQTVTTPFGVHIVKVVARGA